MKQLAIPGAAPRRADANELAFVTVRLATGELVERVNIQGSGGAIPYIARARISLMLERASAGLAIGCHCYEPKPGHVRVYRSMAAGKFDDRVIDIRGATLVSVE